jgi:RimJ/RimL family protein N-acetyltransferase
MKTPAPPQWTIPLHGLLVEGRCVAIGWPEESEFDAITALRNRSDMRRQFLDSRPLDPARNREWLRSEMKRPYEAMLSIRIKGDGAFVGAIGWSHGDPIEGSFELGRVMVDARALLPHRSRLPADYPGVAVDAGMAIRDFAFEKLGLSVIRMAVIEANRLSLHAALSGGGHVTGTHSERRSDGSELRLIDLECRHDDWLRLKGRGHLPRRRPHATRQRPAVASSS